jgi:superfamily II DNA or RNA helicase
MEAPARLMLILHTVWTGSVFNLWFERLGLPRPAAARREKAPTHPHALAGRMLDEARARIHPLPLIETSLAQRLPSDARGVLESIAEIPADARLELYRVPILRIDALPALDLLLRLEDGSDLGLSPGTRAWQAAARWVLSLVRRGRIVPTMTSDGTLAAASWDVVLDDRLDLAFLEAMEDALPAAALIDGHPPRPALLDFARSTVRRAMQGLRAERAEIPDGWPTLAGKWLAALQTGRHTFNGSRKQLLALEAEIERWTRPAVAARRPTLSFRLVPPADGATPWTVEVLVTILRAEEVPPLRASRCRDVAALAATPWAPFADELGPTVDRLAGEAAAAFPEIARGSDVIALDDDAVVRFLLEHAPALQERGFTVLVPPGMPASPSALDLHLDLRDGPADLSRETLLRFAWEITVDGGPVSVDSLLEAADRGRRMVRSGGRWVMLGKRQASRIAALIRSRESGRLLDALRIAGGAEEDAVSLRLPEIAEREVPVEPPRGLRATLRPYQRRGLSWLSFMRRLGLGACLADDMGLGKTIQVIALLLLDREADADTATSAGPVLLVCPTSLVGNWRREIERFAPALRVLVHHGGDRDRDETFVERAGEVEVVLTTYGLVHRDLDALRAVQWRGVVLDEAQNIKNPQTAQSQAVRQVGSDAGKDRFRIALTGTPVENRLSDLWSIVDFLNPGLLGTASAFQRRFAAPIQKNGDRERMERLRQVVSPLLLRRSKTDPRIIADLPEKLEMKVYCPLSDEQARLYRAVSEALLDRIDGEEGMERRSSILAALTRLKQICNHPVCGEEDGPLEGRSGKLERLEEMLEEVMEAGERALVFTQFARWGERLVPYLQERLGREVLWLHGGLSRTSREGLLERFSAIREGAVFVLSLKAGGTGLNLVNANHVFHFDRWWNPAVENQATDRAFRIGQTRNVQVHKFISEGTLEESIDRIIESKTELADGLLGSGEGWLTEMSSDDLRRLVELQAQS